MEKDIIIAGDTNDLKLDNILNLSPAMRQLVSGVTRLDPPAMLDPIISTLGSYYQLPILLPPLDPDPESNGKPSDHLIGVMRPINTINNKPGRVFREIKVRPLPDSGLAKFRTWIQGQDWDVILKEKSVDSKAEIFHNIVLEKVNDFCSEKVRIISDDDCPWFTEGLRRLHRKKNVSSIKTVDPEDTRDFKNSLRRDFLRRKSSSKKE